MTTVAWRLAAALAVLFGALCASAVPAGAHAVLLGSDPADESVLGESPRAIVLRFSEPVSLVRDGFSVFDARGERVAGGDPLSAGTEVSLPVPTLSEGTYIVSWRVLSGDSHPISGSFLFSVGAVHDVDQGTLDRIASGEERQIWEVLGGLSRFLSYLGALVASGVVFFLLLVDRRAAARALLRAVRVSAVLVAVGGVLGAISQGALAAAGTVGLLPPLDDLSDAARSTLGLASAVLAAGMLMLAVLVGRLLSGAEVDASSEPAVAPDPGRPPWPGLLGWLLVVVALVSLASFALVGHNRTTDPVWLVSLVDVVHLVTGALWVGGVFALLLSLRTSREGGASAPTGAGVVQRFSTVATFSLIGVALAGGALSSTQLESPLEITESTYGVVLLAKLVVVLIAVTGGAYNRFWLVPRIVAVDRDDASGAWHELRQSVAMEAVALVLVLGATAALVNITPPGNEVVYEPFAARIEMGDGELDVVVLPARAGQNELHITYLGADGLPEGGTGEMALAFSQPERNLEPITREARLLGEGHWIYEGGEMAFEGEWQIRFTLLLDSFTDARATLEVPIR